jgi:hypothetical protein
MRYESGLWTSPIMRRFQHSIIDIYTRLLRLYPPQFRADFADEMQDVFAQAVSETTDTIALLSLLTSELRDLPVSLIREHLRERHYRMPDIITSDRSRLLYRTSVVVSLVMVGLYSLIVIRPVIALNLDKAGAASVMRGDLNVHHYVAEGFFNYHVLAPRDEGTLRGFLQRDTLQALLMALIAYAIIYTSPLWLTISSGILTLNLGIHGRQMQSRRRIFGGLALVANTLLIVFLVSPTGHLVLHWWGISI